MVSDDARVWGATDDDGDVWVRATAPADREPDRD